MTKPKKKNEITVLVCRGCRLFHTIHEGESFYKCERCGTLLPGAVERAVSA